MNNPFERADWIWLPEAEKLPLVNVYAIFRTRFAGGAATRLRVSVAGNFAAFVNGCLATFGQYTDFPWRKTFSEADISPFCTGRDKLLLSVHFSGNAFTSHYDGEPGVIAEIVDGNGEAIASSGPSWEAAPDLRFAFGERTRLSGSLNYTFSFDGTRPSAPWAPATVLFGRSRDLSPRPVPPPRDAGLRAGRLIRSGLLRREDASLPEGPRFSSDLFDATSPNGVYALFDLGRETAGLLQLETEAPAGTVFEISHGEYVTDGRLPACVVGKNPNATAVDRYITPGGRQLFLHPLRRFGGRFLEIHALGDPSAIKILVAGLRSVELPGLETPPFSCSDSFFEKAHEISAETLRLCLHEKYENCPWREQSICAYDARNQMLFGYPFWGNYQSAEAMIRLFADAQRGNGFLRAAAPSATKLWIPMFTFSWMSSIHEFVLHSGQFSLWDDLSPLVAEMLEKILSHRCGDLYAPPNDEGVWNYCESSNLEYCANPPNAFYNLYLREALLKIAALFTWRGEEGRAASLRAVADEIGRTAASRFFDAAVGGYFDSHNPETGLNEFHYGHIQALFLSQGLVPPERVASVIGGIREGRFRLPSLAALPYLIEGVFKHGSDEDRDWLHAKLRELYGGMAATGDTTWWEDAKGREYAGGRGSLCHGWSAAPAFYESRYILGVTPLEPGYRRFRFKPFAPCGLARASGTVTTPFGPISVSWNRGPNGIESHLDAPADCRPK